MSGGAPSAVRSVAVVGRGRTAWLAAIALRSAFGRQGLDVTVVEQPGQPAPQAFHAVLPDLLAFHKPLGVTEGDLLRGADAAYAAGQQFVGWSGGEGGFLHGYGATGEPIGDVPFVQFWARARRGGLRADFADFSLSANAARHGRLALPGAARTVAFGLHLDAAGYLALLRRRAAALGVVRVADAAPVAVVRDGAIAELRLAGGRAVAADLYVDATGQEARLIEAVDPGGAVEAPVLPCDRLIVAAAPPFDPPPLHSRTAAHAAGWVGLFPLAGRTAVAMAYAGAALADEAAAASLGRLTGLRVEPDMIVERIPDRIRRRPWVGNCVAVGAAAADGDPLDAAELHRDQIAIAHLVALLPVDRAAMVEAGIYNDEVVAHHLRLRDFQAARYRLNARRGEPFWDRGRAAPASDPLEAKIALFAARGMVAQHNQEAFNEDGWQSLFVGHGLLPRSPDPRAAAVPEHEVARRLQAMLATVARDVAALVPHPTRRQQVMRA